MDGDVVHLEPGDLVPVDGVLIDGFNVKCDESQATGESDIIRKRPSDDVYAAIQNHESLKKMDPLYPIRRTHHGRSGHVHGNINRYLLLIRKNAHVFE